MTHRLLALLVVGTLFASVLLAEQPSPGKKKAPETQPSETVMWNLDPLSREPLKLIKATPSPATGEVVFLLEFTRPPKPSELFDWEQRGGPVLFRFRDADEVVIQTVRPNWEGGFVPKTGARIRLILPLPSEATLNLTRSIVAD